MNGERYQKFQISSKISHYEQFAKEKLTGDNTFWLYTRQIESVAKWTQWEFVDISQKKKKNSWIINQVIIYWTERVNHNLTQLQCNYITILEEGVTVMVCGILIRCF